LTDAYKKQGTPVSLAGLSGNDLISAIQSNFPVSMSPADRLGMLVRK